MSSVMVRIFYVTDRKPTGAQQQTDFYGVQRAEEGSLSFGVMGVSIPLRHTKLDSPKLPPNGRVLLTRAPLRGR